MSQAAQVNVSIVHDIGIWVNSYYSIKVSGVQSFYGETLSQMAKSSRFLGGLGNLLAINCFLKT